MDVRYEHSAAAAAQIVNLYLAKDEPKAILFGKILHTIRQAMIDAQAELDGNRFMPSEN